MNLKLKKFYETDFADYFRLVSDEQVMAMITERAIPREEAKIDFEKLLKNNVIHPNFGCFKILDEADNTFIGLAKLELASPDSTEAELGYMLLPKYWGKGIAGRVAKQLLDVAQTQPQLTRLFAIIDPKNLPSRKILINNGFSHQEYRDFDGLAGEVLELKFFVK
ncbi:MAG: GNAT family N-acetyltransferase [Moraxella sp.]|nr:GNAT family N-acetyltransferase [Moraxella sp.]